MFLLVFLGSFSVPRVPFHSRRNDSNRRCLSEKRQETLKHFPDGAVLSNSARGDMIDDDAMVMALKSGKIFSLGLDVYNGEPNIHPEYLELPNVFVLPHLGSSTITTRTAMGNLAVSNLEEFFKTGKCKNTVN